MSKYYKLIDAADAPVTFVVPHRNGDQILYGKYTLYPGIKYVEHIDDSLFIDTLLEDGYKDLPWTEAREKALRNSRYEIVAGCGGCTGTGKKIRAWLVEVCEE